MGYRISTLSADQFIKIRLSQDIYQILAVQGFEVLVSGSQVPVFADKIPHGNAQTLEFWMVGSGIGALGLVKKQLHVLRLEALLTQEDTSQNHELIFLQLLSACHNCLYRSSFHSITQLF